MTFKNITIKYLVILLGAPIFFLGAGFTAFKFFSNDIPETTVHGDSFKRDRLDGKSQLPPEESSPNKQTADNSKPPEKAAILEKLTCTTAHTGLTLIVTGLGLDIRLTERAIQELPPEVILSFSPHATMINRWIQPGRTAGHELLIELNNEKDLDTVGIMTYFDGVLLTPGKAPVTDHKDLNEFVYVLADKQKMLIEGRLLAHNKLSQETEHQNFPYMRVTQALSPETIFEDKQDLLSQEGIVTIPVTLVPYLLDYLNQKNLEEIHFLPLRQDKKK